MIILLSIILRFKATAYCFLPGTDKAGDFCLIVAIVMVTFCDSLVCIVWAIARIWFLFSTMVILYVEFIWLTQILVKQSLSKPTMAAIITESRATRNNGIACFRGLSLGLILTLGVVCL